MGDYENKNSDSSGIKGLAAAMALLAAVPIAIEKVNEILKSEISFPNIPYPVTDWTLWDTLCECDGWRLQQNQLTKHCRIVDPENYRRAWGTKNGMKKALESLSGNIKGQ